ncbi:MAG: AbrB/MazE/SpoVT family DNA-binding domain-containing protein [Rhodoferax sp.]|nr:AbrB/MazE/SpoVT family DNA-binding domain-containing protein [Rhodoferax sp.]
MIATAKVFTTGNSQAIRLPKAFRVSTPEVWISKSGSGGGMHIQPKPTADDLESFFEELRSMPTSEEFIPPRDDAPTPNPFEDWAE